MLWFYTRGEAMVRVETRYDNRTCEYVLVTQWSDNSTREERFETAGAFRDRLLELETQLSDESWRNKSGPFVLPYGWPDRQPDR